MSNSMGLVVSLAEMEQFYRGDKAGQIIELMNKTNDIMDDVLWMESVSYTHLDVYKRQPSTKRTFPKKV